ncbi:glucokinase [Sphingomonas sp.]|uniref:glucokinase n=1 Tax=Sphingomonas sp. TaxID=28214 RepID=UPI002D809CC0|nr:glucokinase [Sphingomonas sp.]HEU0044640.1 glucokinase [Sphingomonas sp.]
MTELVAADIGGTHARFAMAEVANGKVIRLGEPVTLDTREYDDLDSAWRAAGARFGRPLPRAAALGVASSSGAASGGLTSDIWSLDDDALRTALGVDTHLLINDFGAVGHAVQHLDSAGFQHLCGPDTPLPAGGVITICGPGTGVGCAELVRGAGCYDVIETEGGHIGFAPADSFEDALVARLRAEFGRVSVERVCGGPSILPLHAQLAADRGLSPPPAGERKIWQAALNGTDPIAVMAMERFCGILGAVAGDLALAQGAKAVVIAGGLGHRLKDRLPSSSFPERFLAKGRFRHLMATLPVKLVTHPQPGLFGAAAAFAQRYPA